MILIQSLQSHEISNSYFKEADTTSTCAISNNLQSDDIKAGRVFEEMNGRIATLQKDKTSIEIDVMDCFNQASFSAFVMACLLAYFILLLIVTIKAILSKKKLRSKRIVKSGLNILGHFSKLLLDQEDFQSQIDSVRMAWLFACIGVFILLFGYICNLVRKPLSYEISSRSIIAS